MTTILREKALVLLRQALNNPSADFRDAQWEAIEELLLNKSRLLVVQRTGWGKSLVYFLATRLLRDQGAGCTLLISPLLALMRNQIAAAKRIGIRAETINSSNTDEWSLINTKLLTNQVDVLLISPERLANEDFYNNILLPLSQKIGLFVVDEAHCISDWGHDFRPDYRRIVRVLQGLPPNIPVLATTATANNRVFDDIKAQLGQKLRISRGDLTRKSLRLQNIYLPSQTTRLAWLAQHLPQLPGSGIIYALTVRDAQRVADWLNTQGINAKAYFGELDTQVRIALEDELLNNEIKALVATTALGMGFDKPDLGFVIHYQRPGSVVHYYQQVGRAGRAVETAYGILLSGDEDDQINNYFINTAFPPEIHTQQVLNELEKAVDGFSLPQLEQQLNLSRGQIDKVLKILSLESPAPVSKQGSKWYVTAINYQYNREKIEELTQIRRREQERMLEYMKSPQCLMAFLATELDDPNPQKCGRCTVCVGTRLLPESFTNARLNQANLFLRRSNQILEPRKQWPPQALLTYKFSGNIRTNLRAETGRALSLWGDAGWGELVKKGKYRDNHFDDELVQATFEMIQNWKPQPFPTWVTCVPSLNRPELVPNFAKRLADKLGLPFKPVVRKIRHTQLQKNMSNSYQQAHNLDGAFLIESWQGMRGNVFLIDDMVDSRWTFTVIAALLRNTGSGLVYPLALALNSLGQED
ncbi:RecQ family ATP-dependent DNA helicase [Aphanizomenon flos-aquae NRERC-008]|jgi:ATP-dependent DNA helicase RecQ|uniref:DNA 3'-5' helicase n=1 Tax=Aphanizomenon flos-aquae FACHB-1249 TaxID=2692889 RepID=A0ABR8IV05_APHFL|nr:MULTISPECIES: RecQ family ATP-dependent DNA helicase [Aphanizomenon]MBD2390533.1 RecQ family ATP-dependent DNA helicase [Aphanizomenon flos-aquae FACHB-1171]MBD2558506.1 RecQ family ATP-dependent DNA helicase [Aphanizomenon flos-aquae FACHB-1290]MBD2632476.1 RecQ family ATP-dependent DNA helicase [Aphanizomenon sp. FACHB-1399]MBD2643378.1 RecQ family ATP-dependent DNA helicase [Aphanizomenon sp. FACHB-1401]MBD2656599.1 RecQ family ATP-dependent DNA helicase [Aphanizomenon flos-aquae FACHB-1